MTQEWRIARESVEWVGPITVRVINRRTGRPVAPNVMIAVLPRGLRPSSGDWLTPDPDPDGTGGLGYLTPIVATAQYYGIWAKDVDSSETPVLEPDEVGWLQRT